MRWISPINLAVHGSRCRLCNRAMSYSVGACTTPAGTNVPWACLGNLPTISVSNGVNQISREDLASWSLFPPLQAFPGGWAPDQILIELNISLLHGRETVKLQILICFCRGLEITTNWSLKLILFFFFFFHSLQMQINFPRTNLNL